MVFFLSNKKSLVQMRERKLQFKVIRSLPPNIVKHQFHWSSTCASNINQHSLFLHDYGSTNFVSSRYLISIAQGNIFPWKSLSFHAKFAKIGRIVMASLMESGQDRSFRFLNHLHVRRHLLLFLLIGGWKSTEVLSASSAVPEYVSAVGDPGMRRDALRVAIESWNQCNEVGEEAPNMGSPRAADCFDIYRASSKGNGQWFSFLLACLVPLWIFSMESIV